MWLLLLAGLEAAAPRANLMTGKIDLHAVVDADRCPPAAADEIVVCANRTEADRQRLRPLPPIGPEALLPEAKLDLGGGASAALQGGTVTFPGGISSNRAMVTIKLPF